MAVTRRMRFEIFRRDDHRCRYCGAGAPEAVLTVDHVVPVSLGGSDDPSNLVTACTECNSGKASSTIDSEVVDDIGSAARAWMAVMADAVAAWSDEQHAARAEHERFIECWNTWTVTSSGAAVPLATDWRSSVAFWMGIGFTVDDLTPMVEIAMTKPHIAIDDKWRYFCGIVWRTLEEIQNRAAARSTPDAIADVEDRAWEEGYLAGRRDERRAFEAELNVRERLVEMHLDDAGARYGDPVEIRDALRSLFGEM